MSKITFLGTAGDMEVIASQQRGSGGIILQLDSDQFHIDPGPGSLVRALHANINARDTIGVIATNSSLLRAGDVAAAVSAMTLEGLDHHGVLLSHKDVLEGENASPSRIKKFVEGLVPIAHGSKIGINQTTIKSFGEDKLSLLISNGELTVGYTGDRPYSDELATELSGVNLLIINCPNPSSVKQEGVMNLDDAATLIEKAKPKHAVITSFGQKMLKEDPQHLARELQKKTKVQVTAASDGMSASLGK